MKKSQASHNTPACNAVLKVIGDYWTLNIISAIGKQQRRFCELERLLPTSNPVTLTDRLKKLESLDLVSRIKSPEDKISVIYSLTAQGRDLLPIALRIEKFAGEHYKN
ncbi:MAG TPA: helix-turn-helix domain-containing protein [Candidatus Paceibacterota bacterium]|jgi:DNA-binding HxlR family transcriptional regulator|nr:helix-turn-helix domain-containing protein [Candidatus Paceibacterota bacterium]